MSHYPLLPPPNRSWELIRQRIHQEGVHRSHYNRRKGERPLIFPLHLPCLAFCCVFYLVLSTNSHSVAFYSSLQSAQSLPSQVKYCLSPSLSCLSFWCSRFVHQPAHLGIHLLHPHKKLFDIYEYNISLVFMFIYLFNNNRDMYNLLCVH